MNIDNIAATDARHRLDDGAFLLDVREADEWAAGHSRDATWIALGELQARADEVPTDRTIVCICRSGVRSLRAAEFLATRGMHAVNLDGGMRAWAEAGLDVVTDTGAPGTVI